MEPSDTARLFAQVFADAAGQAALAHLRALTIDRVLPPDAPDRVLRDLEGQRRLYRTIDRLITAGQGS